MLDRFVLVRTVHHEVIDEHAAATNRVHTGRPTAGTVVYPSIGSIVAHERGAAGEGVPAYVLIGYPNVTRGPGFLGAKHGYIYLTDTQSGPVGLSRPADISAERQVRREKLLAEVREQYGAAKTDETVKNYDATISEMLKLAGPQFGDPAAQQFLGLGVDHGDRVRRGALGGYRTAHPGTVGRLRPEHLPAAGRHIAGRLGGQLFGSDAQGLRLSGGGGHRTIAPQIGARIARQPTKIAATH